MNQQRVHPALVHYNLHRIVARAGSRPLFSGRHPAKQFCFFPGEVHREKMVTLQVRPGAALLSHPAGWIQLLVACRTWQACLRRLLHACNTHVAKMPTKIRCYGASKCAPHVMYTSTCGVDLQACKQCCAACISDKVTLVLKAFSLPVVDKLPQLSAMRTVQ